MERRFNRTHYHQNQDGNILQVILYLTLPAVNLCQNTRKDSNRKQKHQKQKQRDYERMKQFNKQKTVCSIFPFYSLENEDIKNMVTPIQISQNNSKSDKIKICNLQEENRQLKVSTTELKDNLKTLNEKQICEHSELQCKLTEMHNEIINSKTECARLLSELNNEQILRKKIETEYKEFEEMTFRAVDKEQENYKRVNKEWGQKVNELKNKIKQLKSELSSYKAQTTTCVHMQGATNNTTTKQVGTHQGVGNNARTSSVENNQPRPTSHGNSSVPGCQKCGSTEPHQPSQCPARNFVCEGCKKKGHHTINCLHSCRDCGAIKRICNIQIQCVAKRLNCAYCGVKGHLSHVCLQQRLDQLGY